MQASTNVLLEGIVECSVNPATTLWNSLYPLIKTDCYEVKGSVRNMHFKLFCATLSADRPAKRSFLGLRSHQSSKSCAYCVSDGTFFKLGGDFREKLGREQTFKDSLEGVNGFNDVASHFLQLFLPYETPVDVLHNFAEGIFDRIHKELFPKRGFMSKSDLFYVNDQDELLEELAKVVVPSSYQNISKRRNATDKLNYFCLMLCSLAIVSDLLSPEARIVLIGLSLLVNRIYTGVEVSEISKKTVSSHRNAESLSESDDDFHEPLKKKIKNEPLSTARIPQAHLYHKTEKKNGIVFETEIGKDAAMDESFKHSQFEPSYIKNMKNEKTRRERERHNSSIKSDAIEFPGSPSYEASTNKKWNPISFGRMYMYDSIQGVPLCKANIEVATKKLIKHKKPFDSSEFLEIASEFHGNSPLLESLSIGLAVMTEAFNSGCSNSNKNAGSSSLKPFIIRNIGFNLTSAKRNESLISLPSGCQFYMSQVLSNYEASNFTSSEYKTHGKSIIRRVFSVVSKKDPFFPAYSASENSHAYCSLGSTFFTKVTNFLINGFNQEHSDEVEIYTIRMCRDAVGNLIDRVRRQFVVLHPETNAEQLAIELKSLLAKHGNVPNTIEFYPEHDEYDLASTSSGNY
ncbi:hypothetical protein L3Y34_018851 [Caenorhabditis briggsae]|uniref:Uncharacterized protein n=1 Tax=Caenorhabditis briggsae TaxID=6238 RepID=A0AAE9IVC7_CAEBR|nr:hypothetical protein L3Y34_018851 [Caenorhabditis briggsae]